MSDFSGKTEDIKDWIESYLTGLFPEIDERAAPLSEAMLYSLNASGKRIRPVILVLVCKAVRGNEKDAIPYACAIEYIHNYSLIHDDLPAMDDDDFRRGKPTNHMVYGEAMAILSGDGLLSAAFELMHNDYLQHMDDVGALKRRIMAGAAITYGCGCIGMVAGQAADIENEGKAVSSETLDFIHENKTAALIRAAAEAGALIGGAKPETVRAMREYGEYLGLAFQIADDILDYDTEEGKAAYPAVHGLEASKNKLDELSAMAADAVLNAQDTDEAYTKVLAKFAMKLAKRTK